MADREPRLLSGGEVIDIGSKRFHYIDTPHVPHGWDTGVMFEETNLVVGSCLRALETAQR